MEKLLLAASLVPIIYLLSAIFAHLKSINSAWKIAKSATVIAFLISFSSLTLKLSGIEATTHWLLLGNVNLMMLSLITFIAMIVVKFSHRYFEAEPKQRHYLTWVQFSLVAVTLVVISNHLLMFWLAWVAISLCFHQLLMFYPERPRAVLAAHKKFIFARLSECLLFMAFALLYVELDSVFISDILAYFSANEELTYSAQIAALLIGLAAFIKCAQLPVHGWLIQVVETPTPISALLHGGIINLGGFLLILFAPLFVLASVAQWVLIVIASISTLLAAMIMMTRVSIKVRLAWSTSAQMGLMLIECALGLYELAMLHLLAHSFYKAFAFLKSNSEVERHLQQALSPSSRFELKHVTTALFIASILVFSTMTIYQHYATTQVYSPWLLLTLAITFWLVNSVNFKSKIAKLNHIFIAVLLIVSYALAKALMAQLIAPLPSTQLPYTDLFICIAIALFFVSYLVITLNPANAWTKKTQTYLYGGFYLDEWTTKLTLRLWPTRLPHCNALTTSEK